MIMPLQHQVHLILVKNRRPLLHLPVYIPAIGRTVHRDDFPRLVRAREVLLQPFGLLLQIALRIQHSHMNRADIEGIRGAGDRTFSSVARQIKM
ncbi:hypothetical protein D3C73_1355060 [compost metagenome]